MPNSKPLEVII